MTKTENKREEKKRKVIMPAGIRNKLVAAISMLMVASIMMVSSTYAWFTLSTAPEVKGITTNVGANGNLEMMLLNKDSYNSTADDLGVVSTTNDSYAVQALTIANEKWGNLVDLSDTSYGLNNIVLNPARLNIIGGAEGAANTLGLNMLWAPTYGSDGRVIDVTAPTYGGKTEDSGTTWISDDGHAGVRALGTSSGASQRTNAWRAAVAAVASNSTEAKNTAISTLTLYGQTLANIMVRHVQYSEDVGKDVYTLDEIKVLQSMVNILQSANAQAGDAIVQAVLAYNLSDQNEDELSDADVTAIINALNTKKPDELAGLTYSKTDGEGNATPTAMKIPTGFDDALAKWSENNTAIFGSKDKVDSLVNANKSSYTYADINSVVDGLINKVKTKIGGIQNPNKDNIGDFMNYMTEHEGRIDITMLEGSGVYANIANLVGNYASPIINVIVNYHGSDVTGKTIMSTEVTTINLVGAITTGNKPAVSNAAGTTITLSDTYGYALDFGFRTNAAGSSLQLQTAGVQRVYSGSDAENTQGSGSYMEFKTADPKVFSVDEVRALMSAIRVAFVTPTNSSYDVLGVAKLNITSNWNDSLGAFEYEGGTEVGNDSLKADLLMCEYTVKDGTLTAGTVKADKTAITALEQNKAKKITVVVYIDGDIVDNTMVANAQKSMSGKLNLQFSSSAELTPMANARMEAGGENQMGVTYKYSVVANAGEEYTFGSTKYTVNVGYVIAVREGGTGTPYFKLATADNSTYTQLTINNYTTALTATSTGDGG